VRDKVTNHNFRRERRAEAVSNRGPSAYQPTALPLGQTDSRALRKVLVLIRLWRQPSALACEPVWPSGNALKGPITLILADFSFRYPLWYIPPTKYFHK